jgi:hypothetical protein
VSADAALLLAVIAASYAVLTLLAVGINATDVLATESTVGRRAKATVPVEMFEPFDANEVAFV